MPFPDSCLRGIPPGFLDKNGIIRTDLFYFKLEEARSDGWAEQSINWDDDAGARSFTFGQLRTDGTLKFPHGAAVIPTAKLEELKHYHPVRGQVAYERQPLPDNPYHGNILMAMGVPRPAMKQAAAYLALVATVAEVPQ